MQHATSSQFVPGEARHMPKTHLDILTFIYLLNLNMGSNINTLREHIHGGLFCQLKPSAWSERNILVFKMQEWNKASCIRGAGGCTTKIYFLHGTEFLPYFSNSYMNTETISREFRPAPNSPATSQDIWLCWKTYKPMFIKTMAYSFKSSVRVLKETEPQNTPLGHARHTWLKCGSLICSSMRCVCAATAVSSKAHNFFLPLLPA